MVMLKGDAKMEIKVGKADFTGSSLRGYLASVIVKDSVGNEFDSVQIQLNLPEEMGDKDLGKMGLWGEQFMVKLFKAGPGASTPCRAVVGDIVQLDWVRSDSSPRSLTLTGIDNLWRLGNQNAAVKAADRRFSGKKVSDVVKKIAGDWKLGTGKIQGTDAALKVQNYTDQPNDLAILKELAKQSNYLFRAAGNPMVPGKADLLWARVDKAGKGKHKLPFGDELIEINVTHNLQGLLSKVEISAIDPADPKKVIKGTADDKKLTGINGKAALGPSFLKKIGAVPHFEDLTTGQKIQLSVLKEMAESMMQGAAECFLEGNCTGRFHPEVGSGDLMVISKANWPFDGTYLIKDVTHTWNMSGYQTAITFLADGIMKKEP